MTFGLWGGTMAVMEAAISSSLLHPNIVQVGSVHACMWAEMAGL